MGVMDVLGDIGGDILGGLTGGLGGGLIGAIGQSKQNEFNAQQAQINRDWQEKMSNSAYQRSTKDMQAAGINPMLAYMQGGAATGSGAQAQGGNVGEAFNVGSAAQVQKKLQAQQEEQSEAQQENLEANTDKVSAEKGLLRAQTISTLANSARNKSFQPFYDKMHDVGQSLLDDLGAGNSARSMGGIREWWNSFKKDFGP